MCEGFALKNYFLFCELFQISIYCLVFQHNYTTSWLESVIFLFPDKHSHLLLEKASWLKAAPLIIQPLKRDDNTEQTLSSSCRSLYIGNPCLCSSIVKFVFFPYDALFPPNVARFHSGMSSFASPTPRISWAKIGLSPFTKQEGQKWLPKLHSTRLKLGCVYVLNISTNLVCLKNYLPWQNRVREKNWQHSQRMKQKKIKVIQ